MNKVNICGIEIDNITLQETLAEIEGFINNNKKAIIVTPNVDHIVKLQKDKYFKEIYQKASLVLADGMPIIWSSKFFKTPLKEKISGSDLFPEICRYFANKNTKIFFLGGKNGSNEKVKDIYTKKYPHLQIVGHYSPPFGFENNEEENTKIINLINSSKPDILFVGLGAPKQEKWIYQHYKTYHAKVSIGIGITFDFEAGVVKRAPKWMQQSGLEWLWRIIKEPKRMWKRYLIDDLVFFPLILKQKFNSTQKLYNKKQ